MLESQVHGVMFCSVIFLPDFFNSIKIKDSFNQDELNCKEVRQLRLQAVEFQSF